MKKSIICAWGFALITLGSCTTNAQKVVVPVSDTAVIEDTYTIIWNGSSLAYRFVDGNWQRASAYDYVFDVVQKRYANTWKSVKSLHRLHPDYDGKAGDRSQAMYFELAYRPAETTNKLTLLLKSSLGEGNGYSDPEFRKQTFEFKVANSSRFAPYDHIRISQNYNYEEGVLEETVLLFRKRNNEDIPFMKNEEKAYFYIRGKLTKAPTTFKM